MTGVALDGRLAKFVPQDDDPSTGEQNGNIHSRDSGDGLGDVPCYCERRRA